MTLIILCHSWSPFVNPLYNSTP